jgi:hypothetical protein
MRFCYGLLSLGIALGVITPVEAAPTYPIYQTEPLELKAMDNKYYYEVFRATGDIVSLFLNKEAVLVTSLYQLQDADGDGRTMCGTAYLGTPPRKFVNFVLSHDHTYVDASEEGWRSLGCFTKGGTMLEAVVPKGGKPYIKASHTPASATIPPPAIPPGGPLPLRVRMKLLVEFENSLSQVVGKEVTITHLHIYKEQSGDTTMCTTGIAEGTKFRLVEIARPVAANNETALARVLHTRAREVSASIGLKCHIAGKFAIPPNVLFSEFWFKTGTPKPVEKGGKRRESIPGILQFTLYEPRDYDHDRVIQVAEAIVQGFGKKNWSVLPDGCVTTEKMAHVTLPGLLARKWTIVVVDGGFDYVRPA